MPHYKVNATIHKKAYYKWKREIATYYSSESLELDELEYSDSFVELVPNVYNYAPEG